jgi:hypothetical protein
MQIRPNERPMKRAMVIGGVASFIAENASKKLARWGFAVESKWHVEMDKSATRHAVIPRGAVDVVIIFQDMVAHQRATTAWKNAAHVAGVPCLILSRKESHWADELRAQGYEPINPNTAAAVAENEEDMPPVSDKPPPTLKPVPTPAQGAPANNLESTMEQIKVLLLEAKDQGLHDLTFEGATGKLAYSQLVMVKKNETL